jgi:hypothetical protein
MLTWKRIVILANSIKRHHRCVAGKEISWDETSYHAEGWIRPIDRNDAEGAVSVQVMRCEDGTYPQVLDIVDVPILAYAADPNHPEDWVIDTSRRWKRLHQLPSVCIPHLCDKGSDLWHQPDQPRRVREGFVSRMKNSASLMLVKPPSGWKISLFVEPSIDGRLRSKSRLSFEVGGDTHVFDNNDPLAHMHFAQPVNAPMQGELIIPFREPENLYFALSLTPSFKGWHYKILASIIRREAA